jgi:hypothetical protein
MNALGMAATYQYAVSFLLMQPSRKIVTCSHSGNMVIYPMIASRRLAP